MHDVWWKRRNISHWQSEPVETRNRHTHRDLIMTRRTKRKQMSSRQDTTDAAHGYYVFIATQKQATAYHHDMPTWLMKNTSQTHNVPYHHVKENHIQRLERTYRTNTKKPYVVYVMIQRKPSTQCLQENPKKVRDLQKPMITQCPSPYTQNSL